MSPPRHSRTPTADAELGEAAPVRSPVRPDSSRLPDRASQPGTSGAPELPPRGPRPARWLGLELPLSWVSPAPAVESRLAALRMVLLIGGVLIPLCGLLPELIFLTPDLNDGAFHLGVARNTIAAIREGANPLDFWIPTWLCGYPLFHYYQPGPYLLLASLHIALLGAVPLLLLYRVTTILALAAFPLANYRAMRWLGLTGDTAAWGAFLSCLISANLTYGIEMESFAWAGWGLFAQAVALALLPLALAAGWKAIDGCRSPSRTLGAAALLFAPFMAHILYGYIAAVSLGLAPFVSFDRREVGRRLGMLVRLFAQAGALLAFFVLPLASHLTYHAKSLYDEASKFDSHGAAVILTRLFSGALLDSGRLPVFTFLAAAGLSLCAAKWLQGRSRVHGWIACGFVLWVLLYFGRATWGPLMSLLPLSGGLHLERLSSGVHLFAIWLAAVAAASISRWCLGLASRPLRAAAGAALCTLLLLPMLVERVGYFTQNGRLVAAAKRRFDREKGDFEPILARLREQPGRVYAGHSGNWGKDYNVGDVHVYHLLSANAIEDIGNPPFSWPLSTDFQLLFNPDEKASYDLYDVPYLLTDQTGLVPPGGELILASGKHRLYRVPSEGPFGIVSVPLAVEGDKESTWYVTMSWVKGVWSRAHAHARLLFRGERPEGLPAVRMVDQFRYVGSGSGSEPVSVFAPPGLFMSQPPAPARGVLRDARVSRQDVSVTVDLEEPGVVLFKSTYHPGWKARIDGAPASTMALTPGLIGIHVPAGHHEVRLSYRSGWSKLVLLVVGVVAVFWLDRNPALWRKLVLSPARQKA